MKLAVQELSKSASRALGLLISKFYRAGGMTYSVFTKLYESLVQPVLLYCSAIWGQAERREINNVQNRAIKVFLGATKNTSNAGVIGDMGWLSTLSKQRIEVFRFYCRVKSANPDKLLRKIHNWSMRRRDSWDARVVKLGKKYSIENLLESAVRPTYHTVNAIKLKVQQKDESDWFGQIWNDRGLVYGNKLRTYRKFKKDRKPEHYAKQYMPRSKT
ncbi:uncharacterized protein LOC117335116 [Pecten maximus]|uniref:uncharacterized protein LOC117335116 n=1 Tax=Pecten maximus TaxID=6579 RepID=UPI0014586B9C|nr:uncharacterized protein LOC117335116 [Pecten maximus]